MGWRLIRYEYWSAWGLECLLITCIRMLLFVYCFFLFRLFYVYSVRTRWLHCLENHALIIQRPNDRKLQMEILVKPENKVFFPAISRMNSLFVHEGALLLLPLTHRQRLTLTSSRWPDRRIQCKGKFTKTGRTVNISKWSPAALRK